MDSNIFSEIRDNEILKKRLVKLIARDCFRNTKLEDFHAAPESRLSDAEMKELMIAELVSGTFL